MSRVVLAVGRGEFRMSDSGTLVPAAEQNRSKIEEIPKLLRGTQLDILRLGRRMRRPYGALRDTHAVQTLILVRPH
jgi:hypothetical protein